MLSEALRLIRIYHDKKLVDLAKELNISVSYLSEIENNKKRPTLDVIEKYSQVFKIKPSSIMFFSEELDVEDNTAKLKESIRYRIIKFMKSIEKFEANHV